MPRCNAIGFAPATTIRKPSRKIAWARTVAVVVPSPATSEVFEATSLTICAPTFSSLSASSISFATVTPSLVIVGEPNFLSSTTLRPRGPSVTFTASASLLMPRRIACRDCSPYTICFAMCLKLHRLHRLTPAHCALFRIENREHFVLAHNEVFLAIELDVLPGVLPEQNRVACLHVERHAVRLFPFTEADSDDLSLLRLFLGAIGDDDSADFLFALIDALDNDAVV